jgi:hypothetical protein
VLPLIPFRRARAIPVLLALLSIFVLATRLDLGFERERIGIRGPHVVTDGRLAIDLPSLDSLAGAPAALVLYLSGGSEPVSLDITFDGQWIRRVVLPPRQNTRVDATVHPSYGAAHRLELAGAGGWRVREIELANVHGFSRAPLSLVVVPRGRAPDRPLPLGGLALLALAVWHWRPRWDWPRTRLPRAVHRGAAAVIVAALIAVAVAEWLTPFRLLLGSETMVLALAVLYAERLWHGGARLVAAVCSPGATIPRLVVLIAAAVLAVGLAVGSRSVGGADVYGYASQAHLLRQGDLRIHQPIAAEVPWPEPDWTLAPLGYAPGGSHTIVPTYPPGLPLLMVLFWFVFGEVGIYLVAPVSAAALVLLTYMLGTRIASPLVGLVGAIGIATSPTVLFIMLTPMSDVPVAAFWMASLLLAYLGTTRPAFLAGLAAGVAILIRPNLVFLGTVPLIVAMWRPGSTSGRVWLRRAAAFALASAPFALFIAWWFNELYGSPFRSGYGSNADLFAWGHVRENVSRYPVWLWETQGPLVFLAPLSPLLALRQDDRLIRWAGVALIGMVTICYLLYAPFDAWWYLRFFVVAFPLLFVLSADAVRALAARLAPAAAPVAIGLFAAILVYYGVTTSRHHRTLGSGGRADLRYGDVGRFAREQLPPRSVVYSMQHSGTIRYYSDHLTLRWTHLKTDWMDRSVDYWMKAGYEPVILLDDWEVPEFLERFGSTKHGAVVALEPPRSVCSHTVFVYYLVPRPGRDGAVRVPRTDCG